MLGYVVSELYWISPFHSPTQSFVLTRAQIKPVKYVFIFINAFTYSIRICSVPGPVLGGAASPAEKTNIKQSLIRKVMTTEKESTKYMRLSNKES